MSQVNMQRRVLGSSAIVGRNGEISGIDFDLLIHRLLLFDGYVLRTVRFKELPYLLEALGYDQTLELLKCGLLEIRCEVMQIGSARDEELKRLNRLTFDLIWIQAHDWDKYVADCLQDVRSQLSLPEPKWNALESAIRNAIRRIDDSVNKEIGESFTHTVDTAQAVLLESTRLAARRRRTPIVLPEFQIQIDRKDGADLMYADTDLRYTRIPKEEVREIVRDGLMGIATLEHMIGEMKGYQAIGGFSPQELPVFEKKLSGLTHLVDPTETERQGLRVAKVVGLPHFDAKNAHLKIDRLLSARESDDLRAFRDWLATSEDLTDDEVRRLLRGYRARVANFIRGGSASMVRLMVEGGIGIRHPLAGIAMSVLDFFLVEHLLPHSGPAAFVNKTFPSLFEKPSVPPSPDWERVRGLG